MQKILGVLLCAMCGACGSSLSGPEEPIGFLLALATRPSSDAVPDNDQSYEINLGAAPTASIRIDSSSSASTAPLGRRVMPHADRWAARLAYEQARHGQALAALSVPPTPTRSVRAKLSTRTGCTLSASCAAGQMCWHGQCTANPALNFIDGSALPCALTDVVTTPGGTSINVLLDSRVTQTAALLTTLQDAVAAFGSTFEQALQILGQRGHTGAVDRDGDGRFTVVFTNATSVDIDVAGLTGFFSVNDFLPTGVSAGTAQSDGNEADLLWLRVPDPNSPQLANIAGTIAHEYTHMTSYALRVWAAVQSGGVGLGQEDLWLDEATAHAMEDLTGWGSSNIRVAEQALENWTRNGVLASGTDSLIQRGEGYMLVRYLIDQAAKQAGATDAAASATTTAAAQFIGPLLRENKLGWQHTAFQQLGADGVGNWLQAVYVTGLSSANASGVHTYDFLPVGTSPITQVLMGINPRGAFVDSDDEAVDLRGPETNLLPYSEDNVTGAMLLSGSALYTVDDFDARHATLVTEADPVSGPFMFPIVVEVAP